MSLYERVIRVKLSEATKATISVKSKTPRQPSTHASLHQVSLGDLIKYSYHLFDFGDNNTDPTNIGLAVKDDSPYFSGNYDMILSNLSKSKRYLLHVYVWYSQVPINLSHRNWERSLLMENFITSLTLRFSMYPTTTAWVENYWFFGVPICGLLENMLPLLIHP